MEPGIKLLIPLVLALMLGLFWMSDMKYDTLRLTVFLIITWVVITFGILYFC